MSRHVADKRAPATGARVRRFAEIERRQGDEGSHPAARALHSRPATRDGAARMIRFVRVDRGWTA
ncbi:MAG: hypothetical protein ACOY4T_03660 [Pseudomonadota bacterium]|jgi:hypothetical protein